ncbi:hypothetical protein G9A89_011333 [Geosiphon pyriformis]|nr:hypothetical protein G9A89_011333 [Geosiphon pyriformis]
MENVVINERQTLCLITKELNRNRTSQRYTKVVTIETIGKNHSSYGRALFQYFQKDLRIPAETTIAESDFCNYINTKINCLLGWATNTERLKKQIHQSLLRYSIITNTQAITEILCIIDMDIKHYLTKQFSQVQQPIESDLEEYEYKSNNPTTAQDKSMNKSLGEYGSLFENLTPTASQSEGNTSTWEQPPAQNPTESAFPLMEETAILQPIGSSNKGKQPALASGEHSNTRTPIPLIITSNILFINWIIAYQDIAKLEKFSSKEDNAYSWIVDTEKAITTNG